MQNEKSIELSYEEVVDVVRSLGFEVLEEADIRTTYAANSRAMLVSEYHAKLFVARKVGN